MLENNLLSGWSIMANLQWVQDSDSVGSIFTHGRSWVCKGRMEGFVVKKTFILIKTTILLQLSPETQVDISGLAGRPWPQMWQTHLLHKVAPRICPMVFDMHPLSGLPSSAL